MPFRYPVTRPKRKRRASPFTAAFVLVWVLSFTSNASPESSPWRGIDEGLFHAEFGAPPTSSSKDKISVVKIDPRVYAFKLLSASETGNLRLTAKEWCQRQNLISAVNAGMFQGDGITHVGYMKNFSHINNPRLNRTHNAVLAFNPIDSTLPQIQIIDRKCQDFEIYRERYNTFVQNIRMISCRQENVWSKQEKKSSMVVFAVDQEGSVLFIFTRAPYSVHDFTNLLLGLPLSIYNAMYLEGGPEASLYLDTVRLKLSHVGGHDIGFEENDRNQEFWPIPNVIGFRKKTEEERKRGR
jgi:hypothetical protein